ncbi:MAG: phosphatase PAP2 family protein [Candidatus Melainabacteria bacterium]|nr:phosphatase PAP2 family protein [Candidatus Melainabacteria bacterium]
MMYFILHPISSLNHLVARLFTDQATFLISIIVFVLISLNFKNRFWQKADREISEWAKESSNNFFKTHAEDNAIFGNAIFHILFSVVLSLIFFLVKHKFSLVMSILFTLIFSWGLNRAMKLIFRRIRPENIPASTRRRLSYCFPSGHVMASIPIYFFSAILLQTLLPFLPWYLIAFVISILVVMSRIYLNHHYFSDVLAGIAAGIFCLHISIWFYFFTGLV